MRRCQAGSLKAPEPFDVRQTIAFTTLMLFQIFNVLNALGRPERIRSLVHERLAVGSHRRFSCFASGGALRPVPATRLRDNGAGRPGLGAVYCRRQLRTVAQRSEQINRSSSSMGAIGPPFGCALTVSQRCLLSTI
jgi:hypothetical protein